MASYTYPVAHPTGTLTTEQIHLLLSNQRVVAKRVAALVDQKFIADFLLTGRFDAAGGGIFYATGEEIFAADSPEAVAPGGEYPKTVLTAGEIAAAKTVKWGIETDITDELIARQGISNVDKGLTRLGNTVIKHVDSVAMSVIGSKVVDTFASAAAWTSVGNIITALLAAQAARADLALGINADTVALTGAQYANVMGLFLSAGVLPRENGNVLLTGTLPQNILGFEWVTSPHIVGSNPLLVDRDQLGGMADEHLGSPGYINAGAFGVEASTTRHKDDKYEVRARRVTVPVVTEPQAGVAITGAFA